MDHVEKGHESRAITSFGVKTAELKAWLLRARREAVLGAECEEIVTPLLLVASCY